MRQRRGGRILPFRTASALGPNSAPQAQDGQPRKSHKKCSATNHPVSKLTSKLYFSIFRFGVLQLRLHRFETIHREVVTSELEYLNILQDRVCALFALQAKAVRIVVIQFELLWLEVHEFGLEEL